MCDAEKIHADDELLFHNLHTLVNSMPRAHRTVLRYVCYILKSVVACSGEWETIHSRLCD
jgi:hypothetical protein